MRCDNCGNSLREGELFCSKCGERVREHKDAVNYNEIQKSKEVNEGYKQGYEEGERRRAASRKKAPTPGAVKVIAIIFTIVFAFFSIKYSLFTIGYVFTFIRDSFYLLTHFKLISLLLTIIRFALMIIALMSMWAMAFGNFLIFRQWSEGKKRELFGFLVLMSLLLIIVMLLSLLFRNDYLRYAVGIPIYSPIIAALLSVGGIYLVTYLTKDPIFDAQYMNSLKGTSHLKHEARQSLTYALDSFSEIVSGTKENRRRKRAEKEARMGTNQQLAYMNAPPERLGNEMVKQNRSLLVVILLDIITCGLYSFYFIYKIAEDVNIMCAGDGERTPGLLKFILLSIITCGFYSFFWYYSLQDRLCENAPRYGFTIRENGTTVLLWMLLGSLLCGLGYLIGLNIVIRSTNKMARAYNAL